MWGSIVDRDSPDLLPHRPFRINPVHTVFFLVFLKYFYCISSDFSDLPDMTDEYLDVSVYALTGWLLYILHLTYIQK